MKVENGTLVCNDEVVPDYLTDAEDKDAIVRVELGPVVRKIGVSAFSSCPHLEEIVFSEGVEEIGRCAFAHCKRLTSVTLPKNLRVVGGGAFVGCECLADVGFEPGGLVYIALDRLLPFRRCAGRIQIERKIAQENARRGRIVLNKLYEALMGDGHPYVAGYEEACGRFERVEWVTASEEDLRELIYSVDNKVAHLGAYANCSMAESEWNAVDKTDCRMLCARIACRPGDADFIEEQRKEFNLLFGGNKKARFNRMVAALLPDRVVQIPSEEALNLLADWLKRNGLLDMVPASGDSWYVTSSAVRNCISAILTEKTVYECGVFCWFLAEALRGTNKDPERQERIRAVRTFLESCGRLFI
ncbi:MAG: leucine-rich repeat domain-containing protein [Kiritimatiellae bacterium]|nr:leucine-rich repeat domain-containing protein [Kiritimatiellia bacterium]